MRFRQECPSGEVDMNSDIFPERIIETWAASTRQAVAAIAAFRFASDSPEQVGIRHIIAICRACGARIAPVAACFGWLRSASKPRRAWVHSSLTNAGATAALPVGDRESMSAFALWRGLSGQDVHCALLESRPQRASLVHRRGWPSVEVDS